MSSRIVVSLFSGAGGLSKGFADAGLTPILACEIDRDAVETYRQNISENVIQVDIGAETDRIVREVRSRANGEGVLAVIGAPPCQGFSTAGNRDHSDPRNRLVFSYLDVVAALRPQWFLFENVEGILTSGEGDAVVGLSELLAGLGYTFRVEKVNFARWGVPQARKRVLIIGNCLGMDFQLPPPTHAFEGKKHRGHGQLPQATLGEALLGLPSAAVADMDESVETSSMDEPFESLLRSRSSLTNGHVVPKFEKDIERIKLLGPGQSLKDLPQELWPESFRSRAFRRVADGVPTAKRGGAPAGLRRLDANHASLTITSFSSRELVHPSFDRPLTLRECARLQTFPDHYSFAGKPAAVAIQIGNAFPPAAAKTIAEWMIAIQPTERPRRSPGLLGFVLTEAAAMSPALQATERRLKGLLGETVSEKPRRGRKSQMSLFEEGQLVSLGPEDRKTITDGRVLGPISMSDREMARLISVVLRDLGHDDLIPEWAKDIPARSYYDVPLGWFISDEQRPFDFEAFYSNCLKRVDGFRIIFGCITKLHRHRRKFEVILRTQPLPTMDQVARRGLLEFGNIPVEALSSG